jgi:hypothetical protein
MEKSIANKVAALTRKARQNARKPEAKLVANSSLHQVIKTKAQADLFMKLLKEG